MSHGRVGTRLVARPFGQSIDPTSPGAISTAPLLSRVALRHVFRHMAAHKVRELLVRDDDRLVGVVSQADVARQLPREISGFIEQAIVSDT